MKANKTTTYNNVMADVTELLSSIKMSKVNQEALLLILDENLKPKAGGGHSANPAILDDEGNIVEAFCRYHQTYYPADEMVISNGKSKGYSKAAIAVWNKAQRDIKKMQDKVTELITADDFEAAKKLSNDIAVLKIECLQPEFYVTTEEA